LDHKALVGKLSCTKQLLPLYCPCWERNENWGTINNMHLLKLKDMGIPNSKKGCEFKMGKLSKFTHDELTLNYIWPQNVKSSHGKIKYFLVCILLRKFEKTW
jgi:hypothetical protein